MLFNSYIFIFCFLPLCWAGFWALARHGMQNHAFTFLTLASLAFYTYWSPVYLPLLLGSIAFNYFVAGKALDTDNKRWIHIGVIVNLLALGYFKYAIFFAGTAATLTGKHIDVGDIILPLGISFFTFHQITYLYDSFNKVVPRVGIRDYALYISFFPQLIAGPVVRAREFLPQLTPYKGNRYFLRYGVIGLSLFAMGLFKKVVIADKFASFANPVFGTAAKAMNLSVLDSWVAALSYTFQLYFDFGGYSDMALGLALLFGFKLPINFYSPYKSFSIAEFWKRWHMTMSRFFRDYLYIPLGGSRCAKYRQLVNLLLTMTLVGLWHGAGWTFIAWGALHGTYLCLHRLYRWLTKDKPPQHIVYKIAAHALTFICVVIGWVVFRATDVDQALKIIKSLFGLVDSTYLYSVEHKAFFWIIGGYLACVLLPSSMAYFRLADQEGPLKIRFKPGVITAIAFAAMLTLSLLLNSRVSEFLYFQF